MVDTHVDGQCDIFKFSWLLTHHQEGGRKDKLDRILVQETTFDEREQGCVGGISYL